MASMFQGLLKTPEQIRQEEQKALQERGLTAAAMLTRGSGGASTALPGLLQGFGASIAQNIDQGASNLVKRGLGGLGGIAGALGEQEAQNVLAEAAMSPQERKAVKEQAALRGIDTGNIESLRRGIERLRTTGVNPAVIAKMEERLVQLQDKALARNRQAQLDQADRLERQQRMRLVDRQIDDIDRKNQNREEQSQAISELLPDIDSAYLSDGMKEVINTLEPQVGLGFIKSAQAQQKAAEKLAKFNNVEGKVLSNLKGTDGKVAFDIDTVNDTYSKLVRAAKQAGLEDRAAQLENERKLIVESKGKVRDIEEGLRKDFRKDNIAATQREMVNKAREGIRFLQTGEGAADIAGIISFMKSLDPNSVVREGEFATASSLGSILDSFSTTFKGYTSGDKLNAKQRSELGRAMQIAAETAAQSYNNYRNGELEAYNGRGYEGTYIVGDALTVPQLGSLASPAEQAEGVSDEYAGRLF